jgi:hypothetical protein
MRGWGQAQTPKYGSARQKESARGRAESLTSKWYSVEKALNAASSGTDATPAQLSRTKDLRGEMGDTAARRGSGTWGTKRARGEGGHAEPQQCHCPPTASTVEACQTVSVWRLRRRGRRKQKDVGKLSKSILTGPTLCPADTARYSGMPRACRALATRSLGGRCLAWHGKHFVGLRCGPTAEQGDGVMPCAI